MLFILLNHGPLVFSAAFAAVIIAISFHEFSHVLAAYLQGDETGKRMGRLTLNPLVHLEPMGLILIVIAGFGWGRPAPFDSTMLRNHRFGPILVAIAGPVSNFVLVLVFGLVMRAIFQILALPVNNLLVIFLTYLIQINIMLMVFNLIPIPPLDGSRVLLTALPDRYNNFKESFERYGPFLLIAMVLFGGNIFQHLSSWMAGLAVKIIG
ncbi:MAG: site-2 protease family protein [Candidatus Kerfeldbacteria bacterium]|nr:site-2 protease family protein [Candidatus Kerfeldbacteria bacterium]